LSPREKKNTVRINVFLPPEDHGELVSIAEKEGSNVSLVVRRIIKEHLANKQK